MSYATELALPAACCWLAHGGRFNSIGEKLQVLTGQCRQRRAASLGIDTRQSMHALRE